MDNTDMTPAPPQDGERAESLDARRYRYLRDVWGRQIQVGGTETCRFGISTPSWHGPWETFDEAMDAVMAPDDAALDSEESR